MVISAVLLSFRRHANVRTVVESLRTSPLVGEILVVNNDATTRLQIEGAAVTNLARNHGFRARWDAVPRTRGDVILFHDDDLLLAPEQLARIHAALVDDPGRLYGARGRNLSGDETLFRRPLSHGEVDVVFGSTMLFARPLYDATWPLVAEYLDSPERADVGDLFGEDDVAFGLASRAVTGRRSFAVNVEPIRDLGRHDGYATHRAHAAEYWAGRRAAIEWFSGAPA